MTFPPEVNIVVRIVEVRAQKVKNCAIPNGTSAGDCDLSPHRLARDFQLYSLFCIANMQIIIARSEVAGDERNASEKASAITRRSAASGALFAK